MKIPALAENKVFAYSKQVVGVAISPTSAA